MLPSLLRGARRLLVTKDMRPRLRNKHSRVNVLWWFLVGRLLTVLCDR